MKLNIANPTTGAQKLIVVEDERKLRGFYDKRMAQEVEGEVLGDEYKGYVFKITGGNDKQGFPMMQGVLQNGRVRLLLDKNSKCYRPRRTGERKRKSVRGCIVGPDLSVLSLVIVKKGDAELPGLTDRVIPRRLGPKRASKIRKLFNLSKDDDVKKYVVRRVITPKPPKEGEEEKPLRKRRPKTKAPKIQRLVTPLTLQRKRRLHAIKKNRAAKSKAEAAEYARLIAQRNTEKRAALHSKRSARASSRKSQRLSQRVSQKNSSKESTTEAPKAAATTATPAKATAKTAAKTAAKPAAAKATKAAPQKDAAKTAAKPAASKDAAKASKPAAAKASKPAAQKAAAKK